MMQAGFPVMIGVHSRYRDYKQTNFVLTNHDFMRTCPRRVGCELSKEGRRSFISPYESVDFNKNLGGVLTWVVV